MAMSELKQRLLRIELARLGFREAAYDAERELFLVCPSDDRMPKIRDDGDIQYGTEFDHIVISKISPVLDRINEIVAAWERAPNLPFKDLSHFRMLNEYNGIVLAARDDSKLGYDYGMHFVTWEYTHNREGMMYGHYTNDYNAAKEDFAVRCGLIIRNKLFNETEMKLIRQGLVHVKDIERQYIEAVLLDNLSGKEARKYDSTIKQIVREVLEIAAK